MTQELTQANPFTMTADTKKGAATNAVAVTDQERAISEVKAAIALAKQFPRDEIGAMDRILQSCTRPTLAESAVYAFPRGGTTVTGPSIRLAEAIAQHWGNLQYGIRELSQEHGASTVEAFAWDMETNVRATKVFHVKHQRKARGKVVTLTDPRDIYELAANQGARRLRACILNVIPGDVTEAAVNQCQVTLANNVQVDEESVGKLVKAFAEFDVTPEMLSHRLGGKHLNSMIAAEMISLRNIYRSLKDGMAHTRDFFQVTDKESENVTTVTHQLSQSAKKTTKKKAAAKKTDPAAPTFAEVAHLIAQHDLETAEDMIGDVENEQHRAELIELLEKEKNG